MSGEANLEKLLLNLNPVMDDEEYAFISVPGVYGDYAHLRPVCSFQEKEGLTLIVPRALAATHDFKVDSVFRKITLEVHSSLNAVGLTAKVSSSLKDEGISANVVAGYYHDHIFVQAGMSEAALRSLKKLS